MTNDAQSALRRIIEKFTRNTRFCLICNHINKISPAIQSRCTRFRFGPLKNAHVKERLWHIIKQEGVKATEDGVAALLKLGAGDMRRSINILQSTSMAYSEVNETNVYLSTGNPLPKDIHQIVEWMLNSDLDAAFNNILKLKMEKGLALADVIREVHSYASRLELHQDVFINLLVTLADVEYRLATGGSEKVQLGALVGAFQLARESIAGGNGAEQ